MRIVEEFVLGPWKCTIFYHQQNFTVKIENGPLRQEYRISKDLNKREIEQLKAHFSHPERIGEMVAIFNMMGNLMPIEEERDDEFDDII